jgi:hypothetical protein
MNLISHGIIDCRGFEIVMSWPWVHKYDNNKYVTEFQNRDDRNWGFLICRPPGSMSPSDKSNMDILYGVIGPIQTNLIQETCLGIPLQEAPDLPGALAQFVLSCGLSIIEQAQIELGDTVVVSGMNPLTISVLVASKAQCASILCLAPSSDLEVPYRRYIEELAYKTIEFEYTSSFDDRFDAIIASSRGKTVFIDTIGEPGLVYSMADRLEKFGIMVFCRQEASTSVVLNLRDVHHRKSAQFLYWSRPENLKEALIRRECCRRAARLLYYNRVFNFIPESRM